ncbi:DUF2069 domain-containing protein [Teredinibacter purpureus]|uniref:DUF2069 domain-containing protein n=1 Tax=Teredinibacter purpureus TaxID=2731756 RepID=UPI0005F7E8B9|nr:DUF2069 domain-containing protein [Teredinibacter purpureus]
MSTKPVAPIAHLEQKVFYSVLATAVCVAGLILLFIGWHLSRNSGPNWVVLLAQSVPVLLLLPGLWQKYYRSYSWLCFLMLVYFVKAVDGAFTSTANWTDGVFVFLTSSLFISAMLAARWLQRMQKR